MHEAAGTLQLWQPFGSSRNAIEHIAHDLQIAAACIDYDAPLALAVEQLDAELDHQRLHLMTERALRYAQLLRCA